MPTPLHPLSRRAFVGAAALAGLRRAEADDEKPRKKPNLVFLFSDQQSSDMLGCYGNEQVRTPNIDRVASQGVLFEHCVSNSPVCTPYRGILMSGQHGLYTGAIKNDFQMVPGDGNYFGEVLRDAGYRTGYVGKWHLYGGDRRRPIPAGPYRYGFDDTFLSNNCTLEFRGGRAYYWNAAGEKVTYDDWEQYGQAEQATQFLDENRDQPFALFVSWHPPHSWPRVGSYGAPEDLLALYDPAKIRVRLACEDSDESRLRYQGYMALCSSIDRAFGKIVDKLEELGLTDDTIVVFTADHGDMLFSRGSRMEKGHPTADSCRVPLVVRWPERLKPRRSELLIGALDLMPTLLGTMGLPVPKTCQGRNLAAEIEHGRDDAVESIPLFLQIADTANWRGLYTRRHTYSFERSDSGTEAPNQFNRLYDRERDPHELHNLYDSREHQSLREKLHDETRDWMERFHDGMQTHTEIARAILQDPDEAGLRGLGGPGRSGRLKGRPIDLLAKAALLLCLALPGRLAAGSVELPPGATVKPAELRCVKGEEIRLAPTAPKGFSTGTRLHDLAENTNGGAPAPDALQNDSVVLHSGGRVLVEGKDYLMDPEWGTLGVAPDSRVTANDPVLADYCYSVRRLDSIVETSGGKRELRQGTSHLTRPEPPPLSAGEKRLANVFVDYFGDGAGAEVFPLEETADDAVTGTTAGRIPKTMAKIRSGKPVTIVAWGDSVTAGGDASTPEARYPAALERMLREKFPQADLRVLTVAVGGSSSRQWLYPDKYQHRLPEAAAQIRWERIVEAKPDLVTVEFVNDAGLDEDGVRNAYGDILARLHGLGAEVILIAPHFTRMVMMKMATLRDRDTRPYVAALRKFANENNVALADASARWEHLWKEGLPYVTLLNNGINHPDDRGHRIFAEELIRCFAP